MHISDELFIEIVNIGAFLIHLGQEKVSFFDSFRPQLLKFFIFYSLACSTWQEYVSDNAETVLK